MNCDFYQEQFSAYYDRELPLADTAEIAGHLSRCANCRQSYNAFVSDMQMISAGILTDLPALIISEHAQEELSRKIISRIPPAPRQISEQDFNYESAVYPGKIILWFSASNFISIAAVLLIGLGIGLLTYFNVRKQPPALSLSPTAALTPPESIGRINHYLGHLEISPDEQAWNQVSFPMTILKNTTLRSKQQTRALLSLDQHTHIALNESTVLKLKDKKRLELSQGELWVSRTKDDAPLSIPEARFGAGLTIDLNNGFLKITDGEINIQTVPELTVVIVYTGRVVLASRQPSAQVEIEPGTYGVFYHSSGELVKTSAPEYVLNHQVFWVPDILTAHPQNQEQVKNILWRVVPYLSHPTFGFLAEQDIRNLGPTATGPLTVFLNKKNVHFQMGFRPPVARLLSEIGDNSHLAEWVELLKDDDEMVRYYMAGGLKRLTGNTFGGPPEFWKAADRPARTKAILLWENWLQEK